MTTADQLFCLRWNNFQMNVTSQFESLRNEEEFVDVTLVCGEEQIKAHKLVLSACSPYFKQLFKGNPCKHPIVILQDVQFEHVRALVDFMYAGEVNVVQAQLQAFLRTADSLKVRGLTEMPTRRGDVGAAECPKEGVRPHSRLPEVHGKRPRLESTMLTELIEPKTEPLEYGSDSERKATPSTSPFLGLESILELHNNSYSQQGLQDAVVATIPQSQVAAPGDILQDYRQEPEGETKPHSLDPRPCPECGRVYSNISNLRQHMRLIHYPECIACPLCFKPFKNKLYLKRHLISYHEMPSPSIVERNRYNAYTSAALNKNTTTVDSKMDLATELFPLRAKTTLPAEKQQRFNPYESTYGQPESIEDFAAATQATLNYNQQMMTKSENNENYAAMASSSN